MTGQINRIVDVRIIESLAMVDEIFDWSKARSPSRTKRRMRWNYARIVTRVPSKSGYLMPDGRTFVCHPAMAAEIRQQLNERAP